MTETEKLEQINNFLDCIAKYTTDDNNGIKMSLIMFDTDIYENISVFKTYQRKKWEQYNATSKDIAYFEEILHNLQLTEIKEQDLFYSKFPISQDVPYYLPYDLTYFSEWFLKKSHNKNFVTGEILNARNSVLELLNDLFYIYNLEFEFFKNQNNEIPQFYTIKNEKSGLIEGTIFLQRGFHLFICFENITFMFEFYSGS